MNLLGIIVLVFQISSVYSGVEFCYRIVGSKRNVRLGLILLDGAAFIPEAIYMRIHQMEIIPNNPSLMKKDVQYMLQRIPDCHSGYPLDFIKLIEEEDYRTLVFVTFSLDVGGKQVVGSLYLDMNTYTQRYQLNCFENTMGLELGVAKNSESGAEPLETIDGTLTTTVERINSLQNGQVYSIQFLKYLRDVLIYFMPNTDHIYQSVPRYAEIEISFEDQRGRQLSNPEKIKDIVQIQAVEKSAMQGSEVPFYTTEYMKKHNLPIEIKEPDTGKIWRSVQAFSDGTFSPKAMSNSNSEIIGIILNFVDQTINTLPAGSIKLFETFTKTFKCRINNKPAFVIEKSRKGVIVSEQSMCLRELYAKDYGFLRVYVQEPCSQVDINSCKLQVQEAAQK